MLQEFDVRRFTRRCAATDRELAPGETYYSVLIDGVAETERRDISAEAWTGPPDDALGWWRSAAPDGGKPATAPNEVLLGLVERWANDPRRAEMRYVLALLLVRRRVLRIESEGLLDGLTEGDATPDPPREALRLYCPASDAAFEVPVATPGADRLAEVEQALAELLHTDAA